MKYIIFTTLLLCLFSCKEIENNIKKDDTVAISKIKTNFLHLDNNNYENIPLIIQKNGKNITDILCELKFMEVNYSTKGNKGEFIIYLIDKHLNSMKINTVFKQYLLSGFRGEFAQFLHLDIDKYLLHKKNELNEFQKIELLSICLWIDIYANGSVDVWRKYFVINHTQNILMSEKNIRNFIAGEMNEHSFILYYFFG